MGRFTNRFKISKEKRENLKRTLKNIPRWLYAKVTRKPFHKTMKYKEEEEKKTKRTFSKKKEENKKLMKQMKNYCKFIKNTNPHLYRTYKCEFYENHPELEAKNLANLSRVNIGALEVPVGNTNIFNVANLPLEPVTPLPTTIAETVPVTIEPEPYINLSQAKPYTYYNELQNIRNAIEEGKYVRNTNLDKLKNTGEWDNLRLVMKYATRAQKMKNRKKRVQFMTEGGTRKLRKH